MFKRKQRVRITNYSGDFEHKWVGHVGTIIHPAETDDNLNIVRFDEVHDDFEEAVMYNSELESI